MNLNIWFRLFFTILSRYWKSQIYITDVCKTNFIVLPNDLDLNLHMNNARYFAFMDLGRLDMMQRSKMLKQFKKRNWYPVVADETISFGKSLDLFDKFTLETKIHGWDEKYFYIEQKFKKKDIALAGALVKSRILSKKRALFTNEIFEEIGINSQSPDLSEWIEKWKTTRNDLLERNI